MNKFLKYLAFAGLLSSTSANAGVPLSFTHQGLLKEDGNLVNGEREITAIIMDENDSEVARTSSKVPVDSGRYIMTITGIDSDRMAAAQKLKLWVQVEGELLTPALTINSVPYALVANRAESVNTSGSKAAAVYGYAQDGGHILEDDLAGQNVERCLCDKDENNWDCPESFEDLSYNVPGCYDKNGAGYQYYKQNTFARPVETVVVENNTIGIGTAQPEAPLHIFSDVGETGGYDVRIGDPNPRILLDDLQGNQFVISGENGQVAVSSVTAGEETNLLVVNNAGVQVNGTFNATTVAGDMKINSENITDGSIVNDDIQNNTIKEEKLDGLYPAKAFGSFDVYCKEASACGTPDANCSWKNPLNDGYFLGLCESSSTCTAIDVNKDIGKNINLTKQAAGVYLATFDKPMTTEKYAVVITSNNNNSYYSVISDRTTAGFKITFMNGSVARDPQVPKTSCYYSSETKGDTSVTGKCNPCRDEMLNKENNNNLFSIIVYE